MKYFPALLFMFWLVFAVYSGIYYGIAGIANALVWGFLGFMGLGAALCGKGMMGGVVGVFGAFISYVVIVMGIYGIEIYMIDGDFLPGKKYGPGGDYFASKMIGCTSGFCESCFKFLSTSHENLIWVPISICAVFVVLGLLFGKKA